STGYYEFCDLLPGDYTLTELSPDGYISTTPVSLNVNFDCSENLTNQNFTNQKLLCISGFKKDACTGEGIEGWLITINNSTYINSLRTGPDGYYRFCDLLPGDYTLAEETKDGYISTSSVSLNVTLGCSENLTNQNFTNQKLLCISGFKLHTFKKMGLADWTITLNNSSGTVATTQTDSEGRYEFCKLYPGTYTVCETLKEGWKPFGDVCRKLSLNCSDVSSINFSNMDHCCIGGKKIVPQGRSPEGFVIEIKDENGTMVASITTPEDGNWSICDLPEGSYTINELSREGWETDPRVYEIKIFDDCGRSDLNFYNKPPMNPLQFEQFCEAHKISGTGAIEIGISAIDKKIALDYSNIMAGKGDFELDQETAYSQVADKIKREIPSVNGSEEVALNLYQTNRMTYAGDIPLVGGKLIKSNEMYGGVGANIEERFAVNEIEQEQTAFFSSTTPYVPANNVSSEDLPRLLKNAGRDIEAVESLMTDKDGVYNPAHLVGLETKNVFKGTWGTDASWHKIFYKDIRASEMFSGQFEVDKLIKFHEHPVPVQDSSPCSGIDC
ncbi:MAG: hypothetical protein GX463_02080, partial [Methanothrix sp.]|nr:hypothetical protein [Methanothrix sp.]